jgi:hypothetical protein
MTRTSWWTRGTLLAAALAMVVPLFMGEAKRASLRAADHRDAPAVDERPDADVGDVFAFTSPNDSSKVIFAMGVNGLANPPHNSSFSFGPDVLYQIKIDNSGDAREDIVLQARFEGFESVRDSRCPAPSPGGQFITVRIGAPATTGAVNSELSTTEITGCTNTILGPSATNGIRVFAGLREDPFVVDLSQLNRLLADRQDVFRQVTSPVLGPLRGRALKADGTSGDDSFAGFNASFLVFEVPKTLLQGSADRTDTYLKSSTTIGVWGTTSLQDPAAPTQFVQADRTGQELINTVFIPGPMKDAFNQAIPENDAATFGSSVPDALTTTDNDGTGNTIANRAALLGQLGVTALPGGVPLLLPATFENTDKNLLRSAIFPDVLRLDLSRQATELGIGGNGLQNGRRLGDDVTDIALRLLRQLADVRFPPGSGVPGSGPGTGRNALDCTVLPACPDRRVLAVLQGTDFIKPDSTLGDLSTSGNEKPLQFDFPYFASPHPFPGDPGSVLTDVQDLGLMAAVLPSGRSVTVGSQATAFISVLNPSATATALGVSIALATPIPGTLVYQTTNPANNTPTGAPNTPVDIPPGGSQTFVITFTPTAVITPQIVEFNIGGTNTTPAASILGVNTWLLTASTSATPDIIAVAATTSGDGILTVPVNGSASFSVAVANVGAAAAITASVDAGTAAPPLTLSICRTDPTTSACLAPPGQMVTTSLAAGATATYGVFVGGTGQSVPLNAAQTRAFVRFKDEGDATRGLTSVAVRTTP